ncbi:MAG TPA: class I SAM-dependent methyltransferase [Candidatus Binataceae bacterium]|nr:class I SAM-dependent methyltransferase [Candidatus Binataceae bacterium]
MCGADGVEQYKALTDRMFGAPGGWNLRRCVRRECGLIWQDPMLSDEQLESAYANYFTHEEQAEASDSASLGVVRRLKYLVYPPRRFEDQFPMNLVLPTAGRRYLDVGCGGGADLRKMKSAGWQVCGVESDPKSLERLRRLGLDVRRGTLEQQKFTDDAFDAITMGHVIEHVARPAALLGECRRILAPGGVLIVTTPNSASLGHRLFGVSWAHLDPPRHRYIFNASTLGRLAREAGFSTCRVVSTARYAGFVFIASNAIKHCGSYDWNETRRAGTPLGARLWEFAEWALVKAGSSLGEEILLSASK